MGFFVVLVKALIDNFRAATKRLRLGLSRFTLTASSEDVSRNSRTEPHAMPPTILPIQSTSSGSIKYTQTFWEKSACAVLSGTCFLRFSTKSSPHSPPCLQMDVKPRVLRFSKTEKSEKGCTLSVKGLQRVMHWCESSSMMAT